MRLSLGKFSLDLKGPTNLQVRGMLANLAPAAAGAFMACGVYILWRGGWPEDTAEQRIQAISLTTLIMAVLMGLGMFYLWQLLVKKIDVTGPGGFKAAVEVAEDSDQSPGGVAPTAAETVSQIQESHASSSTPVPADAQAAADQVAAAAVDEADRMAQ